MAEKAQNTEINIKLKPFLGIRPGVYLTILYGFILLVLLFFLLVVPGLRNNGAMVIVKTEPAGAAIRVNDVYLDTSDSKFFVPKGTYTITAAMPGFESQSAVHEIPGRVFGSLFFPKLYKAEFSLSTADPVAAFALYAGDYAAWTFAGEPTMAWQIPMSLSEGAYRLGPYAESEDFEQILRASARFAVTRAALRDLVRAKFLVDNGGNAPSPVSFLESVKDIAAFLSEYPEFLEEGVHGLVKEKKEERKEDKNPRINTDYHKLGRRINIAGLGFIEIQSNTSNNNPFSLFPFPSSLFISETPVPRSLFETFLNENPEWREHQTDYFPEEISSVNWELDRNNATGMTWYAAEAFCKWLTLPSMTGMEARLPLETEWEIAVLLSHLNAGNFQTWGWEWCYDPHAPLNFITADWQAVNAVSSPERTLRGKAPLPSSQTRTSLPPDLSSPLVTFRVVIAPVR